MLLFLGLFPQAVAARIFTVSDTLAISLDSTIVTGARRTSFLKETPGATFSVETEGISRLPSLLGSADPLRFTRYLPSVQTGSELDAGVHIEGCDSGHNIISAGGVPVYGATHLLGLFSVFNPLHFSSMDYSTTAKDANRLGGSIDMMPDLNLPEEDMGDISIGLASVQGTCQGYIGDSSTMAVSLRKSILNLLYSSFLKVDNTPFYYDFGDVNLTWVHRPAPDDLVWGDIYFGADVVEFDNPALTLGSKAAWKNAYGAVHWNHGSLGQTLYMSYFDLGISLEYTSASGSAFSSMQTIGYKGSFRSGDWRFRLDAARHDALPQRVVLSIAEEPAEERQSALETTAGAAWEHTFWDCLRLGASLDGMFYLSPEKEPFFFAAPGLSAELNLFRAGKLGLRTGLHRQHLFQTGLTSIGLPSEFWFLAGKYSAPQTSWNSVLTHEMLFLQDRYSLSVEGYYRRLFNQVEYDGSVFDLFSPSYNLEDMLIKGDGWNYGLNLMLHKRSGKLTGWLSASLGRSLRRSSDGDIFPSAHERLYEFKAVATWNGGRWDAGASFVAASGTPYTAPEALYLVGNRIICRYGDHNGERLSPYIRLDISSNIYFRRTGRFTHGLNLSLYNALGRDNEIARRLKVSQSDGELSFSYSPFSFALKFMPSIGWFMRF